MYGEVIVHQTGMQMSSCTFRESVWWCAI